MPKTQIPATIAPFDGEDTVDVFVTNMQVVKVTSSRNLGDKR
jgi:hypothetical protein